MIKPSDFSINEREIDEQEVITQVEHAKDWLNEETDRIGLLATALNTTFSLEDKAEDDENTLDFHKKPNLSIKNHSIEFFYWDNVLFVKDSIFGTAMRNLIEIGKTLPEKRFVLVSIDKKSFMKPRIYYLIDLLATEPNKMIITNVNWKGSISIDDMVTIFQNHFNITETK